MEMDNETPELIALWVMFCLWFAFFLEKNL